MFRPLRLALLMAGFAFAAAATAQQAPPDYDAGYADAPPGAPDAADVVDPPQRVARLSLIRGAVSFVPAGENDWVEAQLNRPLVTGDKLWTDSGSRTELQLGAAAIRASEQTSINFLNLDDQNAQVEMTQGILNLRVRRLYDGQTYEIDTPTLAFVINRVGEYRVDVAPDGHGAIVTVFHGSGDAYGEGGARFRVEEGQSVRFNDAQLRDYASNNLPPPDDFDRFCLSRDSSWDGSPSRQYVAEDVIGYEDLDNNGSWSDEPEYGNVWYPSNVAVGWTPYSYGSWGWVGAYGWTWVDSSPWGFAPFHYGRWAYVHNRWGWCPGSVHVRPYYAPALVAFIGNGNARVGFSTGAPVGWFPLGPRDVYVPGYRVSHNYFTRVNVYAGINSVQINNYYGNYSRGNFDYARVNYANRNVAGAVTAVPGNVFIGARQIRGSALPVTHETFANGHVSGFAAVAPTRQSLGFGGARAVGAPRVAAGRNVIAATRPPAPVAPFAQREAVLQRDPGRALPARELRSVSVQGGAQNGGAQSMHESASAHANVNVVTSTGRPARLPAQAVAPRGPVHKVSSPRRGSRQRTATRACARPAIRVRPIRKHASSSRPAMRRRRRTPCKASRSSVAASRVRRAAIAVRAKMSHTKTSMRRPSNIARRRSNMCRRREPRNIAPARRIGGHSSSNPCSNRRRRSSRASRSIRVRAGSTAARSSRRAHSSSRSRKCSNAAGKCSRRSTGHRRSRRRNPMRTRRRRSNKCSNNRSSADSRRDSRSTKRKSTTTISSRVASRAMRIKTAAIIAD